MFHHKYAKVDKQGKCLVAWDWLSGVRDGCAIFDWLLQLIMLGWIHKIMLVSTFYHKETLRTNMKPGFDSAINCLNGEQCPCCNKIKHENNAFIYG